MSNYKAWIHTNIVVYILECTYNYASSYTIKDILSYIQLYEYVY